MPIGSKDAGAAKTGGFFKDGGVKWLEDGVFSSINSGETTGPIFEPSPLSAGSAETMSMGFVTLALNVILHVVTAVLTTLAAAAHLKPGDEDKDLTPTHKEDYVRRWCITIIVAQLTGVLIYVAWFGFVRKALSNPIPAILGGGAFFVSFMNTLKLTYYLEIGSLGWTDPADGEVKNTNALMNSNHDGDLLAQISLYLQAFVIASILFTPISGTYYKIIST